MLFFSAFLLAAYKSYVLLLIVKIKYSLYLGETVHFELSHLDLYCLHRYWIGSAGPVWNRIQVFFRCDCRFFFFFFFLLIYSLKSICCHGGLYIVFVMYWLFNEMRRTKTHTHTQRKTVRQIMTDIFLVVHSFIFILYI